MGARIDSDDDGGGKAISKKETTRMLLAINSAESQLIDAMDREMHDSGSTFDVEKFVDVFRKYTPHFAQLMSAESSEDSDEEDERPLPSKYWPFLSAFAKTRDGFVAAIKNNYKVLCKKELKDMNFSVFKSHPEEIFKRSTLTGSESNATLVDNKENRTPFAGNTPASRLSSSTQINRKKDRTINVSAVMERNKELESTVYDLKMRLGVIYNKLPRIMVDGKDHIFQYIQFKNDNEDLRKQLAEQNEQFVMGERVRMQLRLQYERMCQEYDTLREEVGQRQVELFGMRIEGLEKDIKTSKNAIQLEEARAKRDSQLVKLRKIGVMLLQAGVDQKVLEYIEVGFDQNRMKKEEMDFEQMQLEIELFKRSEPLYKKKLIKFMNMLSLKKVEKKEEEDDLSLSINDTQNESLVDSEEKW